MRGGFSFCGTDIADLGLEYIPELKDTNVYRPAKANIHEETFEGHDGSYIYGANKEAKEFVLRVYFEQKTIDRGFMSRFYNLFRPGKSGKLIFQRRPWCYYYVTVTDVDESELTNFMNGIITITMKAAYPFGRCESLYNTYKDPYHEAIMLNTALFDQQEIVPTTTFTFGTSSQPQTSEARIVLANPGTERAKVSIIAAGNAGKGVVIRNETTGQECKLVAMTAEKTTDAGKHVLIDGINGKTSLVAEDGSSEYAFLYHDHGFIELSPAYPCLREVFVTYNGPFVEVLNKLSSDYTNYYIYLENDWRKIMKQEDNVLVLENATLPSGEFLPSGNCQTTIIRMNEITIKPVTNMYLSKLSFIYKPTFA